MQSSQKTTPSPSVSRRRFMKASAAISAATLMASGVRMAHAAGGDTLRVGLIGCGGRGRGAAVNCTEAAPGVKVVALGDLFADQIDATVKAFAERPRELFDISPERCFVGWDAYQKVIDSGVDIVILATPPGFRPMMIEAAVKAGKHIFAEKPIAVCPAGVRQIMAAAEEAEKKGLSIVTGTQRRHDLGYRETVRRIHEGAIGEILGGQVYWMQGSANVVMRKPEWSDLEWQIRNWWYFTWLAGDIIVEQHMHQHDVANWVMGGPPRLCIGMGARQVRTDPAYGHIYDFFAVDYEYPNGAHILSMCRQIDNTYGRVSELFQGTKGSAYPSGRILVKDAEPWSYEGPRPNPYVQEHTHLIESIRAGKPLNEGKENAQSALTAIMGRMSAYTGRLVTWSQAMNSKLDLRPGKLEFGPMPIPPVALPGRERLI